MPPLYVRAILGAAMAAAIGFFAGSPASAADLTFYVGSASNVAGSGNSAPGFASSSWQAAAPSAGSKSEFYVNAGDLFGAGADLTVGNVASISYFTNKPGTAADPDWTFLMYTAKTGIGDTGSFYHSRLNTEPYFSGTPTVAANTWHQWSSDDANNPLRFYDQPRSNTFGTYTDPTLTQITGGPVTWNGSGQSGATYDYRRDVLSLLSFQTGSDWANGFNGLLDGFTITLKSGETGTINFEAAPPAATPLPSSAGMGLGVLALVGTAAVLRKKSKLA